MKHLAITQMLVCGLAFAALSFNQELNAQEKAFQITGTGVAPTGFPLPGQEPRSHWIRGNATHLGLHHGIGSVQTFSAAPNDDGTAFVGEFGSGAPYEFTGANGDKLVCYYGRTDEGASTPGEFTLNIVGVAENGQPIVKAEWIAEFVPDANASTGKFKGASGHWVMYAFSESFELGSSTPVKYRWEGKGRLTFQKKKDK